MKLHIGIGTDTWDFEGDAAAFNSAHVVKALQMWFNTQAGSHAGTDLAQIADKINAGATAVDQAQTKLDTIGREGA